MDNAGSNPVAGAAAKREAYNAYMRDYLKKRYHERRAWAIAKLGGACATCGEVNDLEIDHRERSQKLFDVSLLVYKRSLHDQVLLEELGKCQVLCARCHKAKSDNELSVEHGGGLSGKKNCKCLPCKAKKSEHAASKGYSNNRCRKRNCSCDKRHPRLKVTGSAPAGG